MTILRRWTMLRAIFGLVLVLLIAFPSFGQQSLVGTYKFVNQYVVVDGVASEPMGKAPKGYLVITPTRLVMFVTAENRKPGTSVAEKAALLDGIVAWSGPYRLEGGKIIVKADASWIESWNDKDQVRNWKVIGDRLVFSQDGMPYSKDPSKMVAVTMTFEKIE